jgi:hypothetical protein
VLEADERLAVREASLVRLRKTVPRKIPTVTHRTPRLPQKMPLQPVLNSTGTARNEADRNADIHPPENP